MPGRIETGIVDRLDRDNHVAYVQAQGSAVMADRGALAQRPILPVKYRADNPPPPLSYIDCDQTAPGVWRSSGPPVHRRVLLIEDFLNVVDSGGILYADTIWQETLGGLGGGASIGDASSYGGHGVVRSITAGNSGDVLSTAKFGDTIYADPAWAYWLSMRVLNVQISSACTAIFGLYGGTKYAYLASSPNSELHTNNAGGDVAITLPSVVVGTWYDYDLVVVPGAFAAAWISGDGPYIHTTAIPAAPAGLTPFWNIQANDAFQKNLYVDWIRFEAFMPVADPLRDLVRPGSGLTA